MSGCDPPRAAVARPARQFVGLLAGTRSPWDRRHWWLAGHWWRLERRKNTAGHTASQELIGLIGLIGLNWHLAGAVSSKGGTLPACALILADPRCRSEDMSQVEFGRRREFERARDFEPPATTGKGGTSGAKVSVECRNFIKRCLTYRHEARPDAAELASDDWVKSLRK